jgi:hypothetical protein
MSYALVVQPDGNNALAIKDSAAPQRHNVVNGDLQERLRIILGVGMRERFRELRGHGGLVGVRHQGRQVFRAQRAEGE